MSRPSKTFTKQVLAATIALSSTFSLASLSTPAMASSVTVDTLATQLASLGTKANDGGTVATIVAPYLTIMKAPGFDWNEVMFGSDSLTASQQQTASDLTPDITQIATSSLTTQAAAATVINDVIAKMQSLNSAIQTQDILNFLENMEQNSTTEMVNLLTQTSGSPTASEVASSMHTFFSSMLQTATPAIQGLFAASNPGANSGSSSTPSGGTGPGSGAGTGSGSSILQTVLKQISVGASGTTVTSSAGGSSIQLVVPPNAFSQTEQVSITTGSTSKLPSGAPQGFQPLLAFGVSFQGAAPAQAITLTVQNTNIPDNAKVYKVTSQGWVPVTATISKGQIVLSFSTDPDFVILTPKSSPSTGPSTSGGSGGSGSFPLPHLLPYQRVIELSGQKPNIVPGQVRHGTTYMPIWYVMNMLNALQIKSHWDGANWTLVAPSSMSPNFSNIQLGTGHMRIYLNSKDTIHVQGFTAIDPSSHHETTYMPIYDVMLILNRLHIKSSWNGSVWGLTNQN